MFHKLCETLVFLFVFSLFASGTEIQGEVLNKNILFLQCLLYKQIWELVHMFSIFLSLYTSR